MNLAELAEQDNAMLLEDDVGGFAHAILLTFSEGDPLPLKGDFDRTSMTRDPLSGVKFAQAKASVTVVSSRLTGRTIDDTVKVTVSLGGSVVFEGLAGQVLPDDTVGWVTIMLTRLES